MGPTPKFQEILVLMQALLIKIIKAYSLVFIPGTARQMAPTEILPIPNIQEDHHLRVNLHRLIILNFLTGITGMISEEEANLRLGLTKGSTRGIVLQYFPLHLQ